MNASTKANETKSPDCQPVSIRAAAGQLKAEIAQVGGRWHIAIVREDPDTGEHSNVLSPPDILNLVELTTVIALVLHEFAELDDVGLSDDLGCLGYEISRTLGHRLPAFELRYAMTPH